jgi:transcriptional regulator with XRE-family HTH domain
MLYTISYILSTISDYRIFSLSRNRLRQEVAVETPESRVKGNRATVAHNVRGYRRARDWTQEELSKRAGVSRGTIAKVETGEGDVNLSVLSRLAHALGTYTGALVLGEASGYREDLDLEELLNMLDEQGGGVVRRGRIPGDLLRGA